MVNIISRLTAWLSIPALWLSVLLSSNQAFAEEGVRSTLNMPKGVTPVSTDVYGLHMEMFWWCVMEQRLQ